MSAVDDPEEAPALEPPAGRYCPSCGLPLRLLWVHGHGECELCHAVLEACCQGVGQEAEARPRALADADRRADGDAGTRALLGILGQGDSRVLLRETLLNRLCAATGCTWDEAERSVAEGLRHGSVVVDARSGGLRIAR